MKKSKKLDILGVLTVGASISALYAVYLLGLKHGSYERGYIQGFTDGAYNASKEIGKQAKYLAVLTHKSIDEIIDILDPKVRKEISGNSISIIKEEQK